MIGAVPDYDPGPRALGDDDYCCCGHKAGDHDGLTGPCHWLPDRANDDCVCPCRAWEPDEDPSRTAWAES